MKAVLFLILSSWGVCSFAQEPGSSQTVGSKAALQAKIDSVADHFLRTKKVVGFSIGILQGADTLFSKGYGFRNLEKQTPATENTLYQIASVTKLVTAIATLKLVEQGFLSLDNTLLELMPDFPNPNQAHQITVRHLLQHTSGLADYAEYGDSLYIQAGITPTKEHFYAFFRGRPLHFNPGTNYYYCNSGFLLMGLIIEQVSGQSYETFIREEISQPLGLSTLAHWSENIRKETATVRYDLVGEEIRPSTMYEVLYIKGDGGLSATAIDLAHLPRNVLSGKVISPASLQEMFSPATLSEGVYTDYGLGVRKGKFEGRPVWGHTGGHMSYVSTLAYYPEDSISIAVLVNTDGTPSDALMIEGRVALAVFNLPEPDLTKVEKPGDMSIYLGDYDAPPEAYSSSSPDTVTIYEKNGRVYRKRKDSEAEGERLYYLGNHTFAPEHYPMDRYVFTVDQQQSIAVSEYYNGLFEYFRRRNIP